MNQTIGEFFSALAAVEFAGVETNYSDIPKERARTDDLPAKWVGMPQAVIDPQQMFSTFSEAAALHTLSIYIAVAEMKEGFPADDQTAVLEMADTVEQWAKTTPYTVRALTEPRIALGGKEYRGVTAVVSSNDDI